MDESKIYKTFTDLEVWKKAREYKKNIYQIVKLFPPVEKYRVEDQLIRSVRSIGSNISEGYGRFTYKDQLHFCIMSLGSLFETYNHLIDAFDCLYITEEVLNEQKERTDELEKLLNGYLAWLKKMSKNP